jgi:uncharacterized protein YcfJ
MRKFVLAITAASMAMPMAFSAPAEGARRSTHHYYRTCHRHRGTTGAIIGGGAGALLGGAVTHGAAGPIAGAVGGALLGRHIQRHNSRYRC